MDLREFQAGSECARAEARASELFNLYGRAVPRAQIGEGPSHYRRRLLETAAALLPAESPWRGVLASSQSDDALGAIESMMIERQIEAFKQPTGPERSTVTFDEANRPTRRFFGEPCWSRLPCFQQPRRVSSWSQGGRGSDSPTGRERSAARAAVLREAGL
jgi:hypothetical protein